MPARRRYRSQAALREAAAERALEIADREGPASLTMRRLADELDVHLPALYRHFRNKEELLVEATELAFRDFDFAADSSEPWTEQVVGALFRYHVLLKRHSLVSAMVQQSAPLAPSALRFRETIARTLQDAGFSGEELVFAYGTLIGFTDSFTVAQVQRWTGSAFRGPTTQNTGALSEFPVLAEMSTHLTLDTAARAFEWGLRTLVQAVASERAEILPAGGGGGTSR
jgi:AcrR family transcriptional regulator